MISFQLMVMPHLVKKLAYKNSISACPHFVKMLFVNALESAACCHNTLPVSRQGRVREEGTKL